MRVNGSRHKMYYNLTPAGARTRHVFKFPNVYRGDGPRPGLA
jgi:hypothetical protein